MHIDQFLDYPHSPFYDLIETAFDRQTHFIHLLNQGDDALLARIHLIRSARKSINIQTFIWADDESGRFVLYELVNAARRGVKVRLLLDNLTMPKISKLIPSLVNDHPNIEIKQYNPIARKIHVSKIGLICQMLMNFNRLNQRMHSKVFIMDDRVGLLGGRNFANDYFGRGTHRDFKDRDVMAIGPVVKDMTDSFARYWAFKLSIPSQDMIDVRSRIKKDNYKKYESKEDFDVGSMFDELDQCVSDVQCVKDKLIDHAFAVDQVRFVADQPGKNKKFGALGGGETLKELGKLMSEAKKSIIAQTPYLILGRKGFKYAKKLRRKKPDLDILISSNSMAAADHLYAYAFFYKSKKEYLKKLKWRIFEFKPRPVDGDQMIPQVKGVKRADDYFICIHAKTYIADDDKTWIGSFNIDPRSANLNTEVALIIQDEKLAQSIKADILRDMAPRNAWTIGKKEVRLYKAFFGIAQRFFYTGF